MSSVAVTTAPEPAAADYPPVRIHPLIRSSVRRLGLTPREADLTELLAVGCPTKQISALLGISEATIRTHLRKIFASQQIASRVELVAMVLEQVLVGIDERDRRLLAS